MDWRAIVRHDLHNERPAWPATCYAHERGGANDLAGDMSPEEVHLALTRTEGAASAGTLDIRLGKATRTQLVQLQVFGMDGWCSCIGLLFSMHFMHQHVTISISAMQHMVVKKCRN